MVARSSRTRYSSINRYPSLIKMITLLTAIAAAFPVQDPDQLVDGDSTSTTVVTARKFEEALDSVPAAVTVLDGKDLDDAQVRTVKDAVQAVPNLRMTEFSSRRLSFPYIRGIGSGVGEPAVVTYIDGVPQLTLGSSNLPTIGLDRIEVMRGPQSLYGRNALGGVLHMISRRPGAEAESFAGITTGDNDLFELSAGYRGPIGEEGKGLALDLLQSQRDGYTKNTVTGDRVDDRDAFFGRGQLYMNPSADSELRIGLHAERARDGGFVLAPLAGLEDAPHEMSQDFEGVAERDVVAPSVTYTLFGEETTLTSITSYTDWDVLETSDFDFTAIDGVRRETREDQQYFYQEVRLASEPSETGSTQVRWVGGASLFSSDSGRSAANDFRPGGAGIFFPPPAVGLDTNTGDFADTGLGLFGQVAVNYDSGLELAAGLRYDREEKEADLNHTFESGGFVFLDEDRSFEEDFDEFAPSFSAAYHLDDSRTIYASAAKAFKAGGFNLTAPADAFSFDPEEAWAYELGYKFRSTDGDYGLRIAAYMIDWEDMQLSLFDPGSGGYVANAGSSESSGVELEVDARLGEQLRTFFSFGTANTEFGEYTDSFGSDNTGNALPFAPEQTYALGLQYEAELTEGLRLVARTSYQSVGDFFYDAGNLGEESFDLLDLRAGLRHGDWSLDLFLLNLLDEEYFPIAFQANPGDPAFFIAETGAPSTLGFSLRFAF